MRAKDLRKYKTLDITELSGSPWNDAEKVLGLDQDDKVIMAEPEETVTPEYVDEAIAEATENLPTKNWVVGHCDLAISAATADLASNEYVDDAIDQAMEAETARTEDVYAKKSEVPDLDDYYTKEEVDEAISGITVDLSDYYTKDETDQAISAATQSLASTDYVDDAIASETARTESTYLKQSAIEDDQFPTKNWVKGHTALAIEHSMEAETARTESVYAKKSEIPSLDGYAKTTAVTEDIQTAISNETARTESTYLKEHQSLDNYYTKSQVDAEITGATEGLASEQYVNDAIAAIPAVDLSPYAKTTAVTQDIQTAIASETARTENTYAKPSQIPSLDGYATEQWVESQGYLTEHQDLSAYAKTTAVTQDIQTAMAAETARTESTYAKPSDIPSLTGYATENYVDNAITAATEDMATTGYVADAIAAIPSVDLSPYAKTTAVTEDIQTAIASETARTEATYAKVGDIPSLDGYATEAYVTAATQDMATKTWVGEQGYLTEHQSLEDYYTKEQVDAEITGATEGMATTGWVESQGYLTEHQDLSAYAKTTAVTEDIASAMAAETARTENTYAKPSQIPSLAGYATETYVDNAMASETARTESTYLKEHQDISGKLNKTDFDTYTGATATVLAEKLDASAYTVDNAIDSASTNPVENGAVYDALYGTSATTELQVLDTDSTWNASIGNTLYPLKNTTIENLKVIYLGDIVPSGNSQAEVWLIDGSDSVYKLTPGQGNFGEGYVVSGDVGNTIFWFGLESSASTALVIRKSYLDGTYEYYLLFDTEKLGCVVYKNLPTGITEVSDHSAQISDLPTAQDGSNFKQYVYNGGNDYKRVVSNITFEPTFSGIRTGLKSNLTGWNNSGNKSGAAAYLPAGSEVAMGVKTAKDSVIIDRAEEALSGMTEQVTLTIGSTTTGSQYRIYVNNSAKNLYTTNDSRYYVYSLPLVSPVDNYWTLSQLRVGGTTYRIVNPYTVKSSSVKVGKYQILSGSTNYGDLYVPSAATKYAIVDVELKTLEITDSLTITRVKSIPEAISAATQGMVTSGDVATQIGTAMASETARTESTYAKPSDIPSLSGYATETWVQNQGYLTQHQSLANYYTKTEIDGMIGDIESLLASI